MVAVNRLRQAQQFLEQAMNAGGPEQIAATHHVGHALKGIVDDHGQMIAGGRILARHDHIAPGLGLRRDQPGLPTRAFAFLLPGQDADARAFLVLRPYLKRAVKVAIEDPGDPAPYWLIATRDPERLAAAITALTRR